MIDGFKTNFSTKPLSVSVALIAYPKDTINIGAADKYVFLRSNTGEAELKLPFTAQLAVPLSFLPIFNFSPLNLFFYIITYFNLFLVLHNISKEKPFLEGNKKRLKWLGGSYVAWGAALFFTNALIDKTVREVSENHLRFDGHFLNNYIQVGLVIFIIAMVYARGIEMEKEAALTI
ncbi:hypothetical protein SanaruYs_27330 [Chryseotalea sanaruensis]|uniref:DUF2975 domain-containing protein n=2 Tax=Chryseotalea sanaruensis TaxID=2482724 RepID=A0A401UC72_9BACT|nr:hypothetical protein SanaruYs_27330 [Chryseotalea sanaruensis]